MEGGVDSGDILRGSARVPEHVVYRAFEAETLLLNLQTSQYHGINATGARVLELAEESGGDLSTAVDRLAAEYGLDRADIEGDLTAFCRDLVERGLLEVEPPTE